jgi:regulator of sigma E protease
MGFRNGDKIISVEGQPIEKLNDVVINILINDARKVKVERNGVVETITIESSAIRNILKAQSGGFLTERYPFVIDDFQEGSIAAKSGLQKNDEVIAINNTPSFYSDEVKSELMNNKGKEISISVLRNLTDTATINLKVPDTGKLGLYTKLPTDFLKTTVKTYSLLASFPAGFLKAKKVLSDYIKQFKLIFSSEAEGYKHLGGFISIAKAYSPEWNWVAFWSFTGFLSIALAFMNLLPIPALDGGHVVFTLYEMITGRKPNEKFLEYAQIAGMGLLFALMIFANGNDILKLFK